MDALLNQNGLPGLPITCSPDLPVLHPLTAANPKHNITTIGNGFILMTLKNLTMNVDNRNALRIFPKLLFH